MNIRGVKDTVKEHRGVLPEHQVFDLELGLDDARGPDSHPQHVHLRGHIFRRHNPGHVIKKTTDRKTKIREEGEKHKQSHGIVLNNRVSIESEKPLCFILSCLLAGGVLIPAWKTTGVCDRGSGEIMLHTS